MLYKNRFKSFQCSMLTAAMFISFTSLAHAVDSRDKTPNARSESSQPQQQATPKPAPEPESSDEDDEDDTALV